MDSHSSFDYASELRCPEICINQMVLPSTMPPSSAFLPFILSTNLTVWDFITMLEPSDKQLLLTEATENSCSASHEGDGKSKDRPADDYGDLLYHPLF